MISLVVSSVSIVSSGVMPGGLSGLAGAVLMIEKSIQIINNKVIENFLIFFMTLESFLDLTVTVTFNVILYWFSQKKSMTFLEK